MMGLISSEDPCSPVVHNLRIVLLGKTGSGKSETGNTILGRKAFKAKMCPTSVTKTCQRETGYFDERTVSVIDTPGVFDTTNDVQLNSEIEKCIELSVPGPHIFLLVVRLDVRFTEEEENAVKWIKTNFGEEASKYTLVIFTRGDQLSESIETYLDSKLKQLVSTTGCVMFDNTCMHDRTQVADLFEKIDRKVQLNGDHYTSSKYEEAQRKLRSAEWWNKCGEYASAAGNQLITAAAVSAAPIVGGAVAAEEAVALSMRPLLILAGAGISKVVGWWLKPKPKPQDS